MNRVGSKRGDKCQPAHGVIQRLGGVRSLARELVIDPSALSKWTTTIKRGGAGGLIPSKYFHGILAIARSRGVALTADDLIGNGTR